MSKTEHPITIQELSDRLNIPKPTLRFWEKSLDGIIDPIRTPGGQRRYKVQHISIIAKVNSLRKEGMSISDIKTKLSHAVDDLDPGFNSNPIDSLADQVSQLVKQEIKRFFETEFSNS
jgi:DNA-binding transcriptional MerR regulator